MSEGDDSKPPYRLFPGDWFHLEGGNWEVMAWDTGSDGERQVYARPVANQHGTYTARWPFKVLQELLA